MPFSQSKFQNEHHHQQYSYDGQFVFKTSLIRWISGHTAYCSGLFARQACFMCTPIVERSYHRSIHIARTCLFAEYITISNSISVYVKGITPFPYKVAKALDPDIYRNIEFDSWSDQRKGTRHHSWYMDDSSLQVCVIWYGSYILIWKR